MEYFVLVKFSEEEVECVSSKYIEGCVPIEELAIHSEVKCFESISSHTKRTKEEDEEASYFGEVLAKSDSRPMLVSLMDTYIKTGVLPDADPGMGKRPRIPRSFSDEECENVEAGRNRQKKKSKKNIQKLAKKTAAERILAEVSESGSTCNSATATSERCRTCKILRSEIEDLKRSLRKANRERDDAYESLNLVQELKKSLKAVKKLATLGSHKRQPPEGSGNDVNAMEEQKDKLEEDIGDENPQTYEVHPHLLSSKGDPCVVKLVSSIDVYVNQVLLQNCTRTCSSPTMFVRNLLPIVFKEEALKKCSARGRKANGLGQVRDGARESLYGPAVDAICSYVKTQASIKGWTFRQTELIGAIGRRLNELRRPAFLERV